MMNSMIPIMAMRTVYYGKYGESGLDCVPNETLVPKSVFFDFSFFDPSVAEVPPTESSVFPGFCPSDTKEEYRQSYSWLPFKGHCYLFITDEIEWANAAGSCVRHGKKSERIKKKIREGGG